MKVISTNRSDKRTIKIGDEWVETGLYKMPVLEGIILGKEDVVNDVVVDRRYHGGEDMACYLFGKNNYQYFTDLYPNADWEIGMFGENITLEFLNESELNIGDIYQFGEAEIQISQPRLPCSKFGYRLGNPSSIKAFADADFPGAYVRVLKIGRVKVGDEMVLLKSQTQKLSLVELYRVLVNKSEHKAKFKEIISNPFVPEKCKLKLKE